MISIHPLKTSLLRAKNCKETFFALVFIFSTPNIATAYENIAYRPYQKILTEFKGFVDLNKEELVQAVLALPDLNGFEMPKEVISEETQVLDVNHPKISSHDKSVQTHIIKEVSTKDRVIRLSITVSNPLIGLQKADYVSTVVVYSIMDKKTREYKKIILVTNLDNESIDLNI